MFTESRLNKLKTGEVLKDNTEGLSAKRLARNINNQQLKKYYPKIPVDDYEENEDWHRGYSRGKYLALEATRNWIAFYFDKHQDEIETVISSAGERPYLDVEFNEVDEEILD